MFVVTNCSGDCCNGTQLISNCSGETFVNGLKLLHHGQIWTPEVTQRIVIICVIMVSTLLGNLGIIFTLTCSRYKRVNSRVNIFIVNLAVGDLAVAGFTMTTEILFVVFEQAWVFGAVACKIVVYGQIITLASATFILIAMSIDRYLALCRPLSLTNTPSRARKMIAVAWIMACLFASPQLAIFKQVAAGIYPDGVVKYKCASRGYTAWWQRKLYFTFLTTYILIIPTILISYCYINVIRVVWRQGHDLPSKVGGDTLRRTQRNQNALPKAKIKTIKMTLCIILSFVSLWTPYFVVHLIHIWSEYKYKIPESVYVFAETAALINSALNPVFYGCFNIRFSKDFGACFKKSKVPDTPGSSHDNTSLLHTSFCRTSAAGRQSRSSAKNSLNYHTSSYTFK